jgi:alkylation response protein AidB-like acyl-CoA dehydrogenase
MLFEDVMPGGGFLVASIPLGKTFTRDDFTDTQREFADMTRKFILNEVVPRADAMDDKGSEDGTPIMLRLTRESGQLGLLAVDVPEAYGGLGLDKTTSAVVAECLAGYPSFATTIGAHAGIGTLPIVYFGNEEQKQRWLPGLTSAEKIGCYALTEPGSGSDALSGRTQAVPVDDGKAFLLTGEKQFITNGAWADVAIVFAQLGGKYTAFIVDLHSPGVTRGPEEKKMGIKGSSTTNLVFEEVKVPAENMLGQVGMAAQIALNILNLGRLKLGFAALGNCKYAIDLTTQYARERKQFGQPIVTFDMQKGHLGDMVADTYATDAMVYRAVGDIDRALEKLPKDEQYASRTIDTLRAWALECSLIKVAGAETLQDVASKAIRMHGGYGFIHEYKVEMLARDNVVDNIYEGTNDINRLTIFDSLARNILGAQIPFRVYVEQVDAELRDGRVARKVGAGRLAEEIADVAAAKRVVAYTINHVLIHCGKDVKNEQQVMEAVADLLLAVYKMDSTVARAHKLGEAGKGSAVHDAIAALTCHKNVRLIGGVARDVLAAVSTDGQRAAKLAALEKLLACLTRPQNTIQLKRVIADAVIEAGGYRL